MGPGTTIASGALPLAVLVALAAGFVSFASPCVLPLVPGFLGYVTGLGDATIEQRRRSRLVLGALLFVLGFTVVFLALFIATSAVGYLLQGHLDLLTRLGGVLVIALALVFLGMGSRWGAQRTVAVRWRAPAGLLGAPLLGAVFALGWAPCVSPTLGAILALQPLAGSGVVVRGVVLGVAYSLGLGLPFIAIAAGWARMGQASWIRRHQKGIHVFGGALLLVLGLLMVTGTWTAVTTWVQAHLVASFPTAL